MVNAQRHLFPGAPMPVLQQKGLIGIFSANEFAHGIFV